MSYKEPITVKATVGSIDFKKIRSINSFFQTTHLKWVVSKNHNLKYTKFCSDCRESLPIVEVPKTDNSLSAYSINFWTFQKITTSIKPKISAFHSKLEKMYRWPTSKIKSSITFKLWQLPTPTPPDTKTYQKLPRTELPTRLSYQFNASNELTQIYLL